MCGIIGYIGPKPVVPVILDGLKRLEYRGYDSAGIAVVNCGEMDVRRSAGKLANLELAIAKTPLDGQYGLGHTRWATHGRPTEENAHPHRDGTGRIVVVHNGIIENYLDLKRELLTKGHVFQSETDTEVVAHLVQEEWKNDGLENAVLRAMKRVRGLFALVLLSADDPEKLVAVRNGPPIVVGLGEGEYFVASDVPAILGHTRNVVFMDDRELVVVTREGARFTSLDGTPRRHEPTRVTWDPVMAEKAGFKHFMLKEIVEQPHALRETILGRVSVDSAQTFLDEIGIKPADLAAIDKVTMVACGTSWHAALVGKFMIEELARIPVEVDYGSEFRYRNPIVGSRSLAVAITQSGETADTLAALRYAKEQGVHTLAVVNVPSSTIAREAETVLPTLAGPEIGVASTKAFTCQLMVLASLSIAAGKARGHLSDEDETKLVHGLVEMPRLMSAALTSEVQIEKLAREIAKSKDVLYLGRGTSYPLALEGALKLKEISYIHAEGYAAGELKHGPIALIDENMPVVVIAPYDKVFEKTVSNMQEVAARGGKIILMTDAKGAAEATIESLVTIVLPDMGAAFTPMVYAVPVQLLAYHTAVVMGTDVDQPRNLAKSVTVE